MAALSLQNVIHITNWSCFINDTQKIAVNDNLVPMCHSRHRSQASIANIETFHCLHNDRQSSAQLISVALYVIVGGGIPVEYPSQVFFWPLRSP